MSIARRTSSAVKAACATCLLIAGYAQAQQVQQPTAPNRLGQQDIRRTPSNAQQSDQNLIQGQPRTTHFRGPDAAGATAANSARDLDHYITNCLIIKNEAEIKANEFGEQRAEDPQVKQFARQMIDDHRQLVEQLERLAATGQAGATAQASTQTPAAPGQAATAQTTQRPAMGNDQQLAKLLDLDRKITDECGRLVQQKLSEKSGAEFDKCFVGAQIGNHIHMLAALEVISQQTSGQLQQVAHEAKAKVQQHLDRAEQLMKQLESSAGDTSPRQARS